MLLLLCAVLLLLSHFGIAGLLLGIFALPGALVLAFLGLPLLLPLASLFFGSYWAVNIGRSIRRERAARTWDLLCAAPAGRQGASHVIISRCLLRGGIFSAVQALQQIALGLCLGALLLMGGIFLVLLLRGEPASGLLPALRTLLDIAALVAVLWPHWLQTVALAALCGLLLSGDGGGEAPWFAALLFPALQLGSWALFALQLRLLQPLATRLEAEMAPAWLLLPLLYLALFLLPREGLVYALRQLVAQRLQTKELFNAAWHRSATAQTG